MNHLGGLVAAVLLLLLAFIATGIVNTAFIIVLAAVGVAFAVSFGPGGRNFASRVLERADAKLTKEKDTDK